MKKILSDFPLTFLFAQCQDSMKDEYLITKTCPFYHIKTNIGDNHNKVIGCVSARYIRIKISGFT